jgi:hypothetical protein
MQQIEELADRAEKAITAYELARRQFADGVRVEQQMEAERAVVKAAAIGRIMQTENPLTAKQHSATSAEAVAYQDAEYAAYLLNQRNIVHAKLRAETNYHAEYLRATLAITLVKLEA